MQTSAKNKDSRALARAIGRELRRLRWRAGFNFENMAQALGLRLPDVRNLESGQLPLSDKALDGLRVLLADLPGQELQAATQPFFEKPKLNGTEARPADHP